MQELVKVGFSGNILRVLHVVCSLIEERVPFMPRFFINPS